MSVEDRKLTYLGNGEMMLLVFNLPVDVNIPTGSMISIVYWDPQYGRWVKLETVTTDGGRIVAATNFFGTFAMILH
jgi:hypothetical protein